MVTMAWFSTKNISLDVLWGLPFDAYNTNTIHAFDVENKGSKEEENIETFGP